MLKAKKSDNSVNIISNRIHRHLNISSLQSYRKSSKVKQTTSDETVFLLWIFNMRWLIIMLSFPKTVTAVCGSLQEF